MANIIKKNPEFTETFKTLDRASRNPKVITLAEMLEKAEFDQNTRDFVAARDKAAALDQGLKEGRKKGLKQGQKQGKKQGRKQAQEQIILNMSLKGFSTEDIASLVEVSIDHVRVILANK